MTPSEDSELDSVGPLLERISADLLASGIAARDFRAIESEGPRDVLSYLLAGVADLGDRLEHMPVDSYVENSKRAHQFVRSFAGGARG
jgi:hypothetical protein